MVPGRFSDGERVRLADGRVGVIQASLGHHARREAGRARPDGRPILEPDPSVGPRYRVWLGPLPVPEMNERDLAAHAAAGRLVTAQDEVLGVAP